MLVNSIRATILGQEYRLTLRRDSLSVLDAALDGSAYAALKRFESGTWSAADVEVVLSLAIRPANALECLVMRMGGTPALCGERRETAPEIAAAVGRNGPGVYADLAALMLSAALFGISESDATWTDEVPADAA